jgi:hypothetical protein
MTGRSMITMASVKDAAPSRPDLRRLGGVGSRRRVRRWASDFAARSIAMVEAIDPDQPSRASPT